MHQAFGVIDIMVCNAASSPYHGPMHGITDDQFETLLRNNILSNQGLMQWTAPGMHARRGGATITLAGI